MPKVTIPALKAASQLVTIAASEFGLGRESTSHATISPT